MSPAKQISREVFPFLRVYTDGTVERYAGTESVPAGFDSETGVLSKDIVISSSPAAKLSARIYRPKFVPEGRKLPVVVYYHGGAFIVASPAFPMYHHCLNRLVREANVVAVSVDYRLAPENPLPAAYEDSWAPLEWLAGGKAHEPWLREYADFEKVFLAGDSAGANIIHHLALRRRRIKLAVEIQGLVMIHPYFWGKDPIGWWTFVCPSKEGCDDPYINPFAGGAPTSVEELGCRRVVIFVAESDILCGIGKAYYRSLVKSEGHNCKSRVELRETKGEDHIFHLYDPDCEAAAELFENWAFFINRE
ncbi:unnamed protein product [Linum tenue]|uniref:Alpha/beta hydrolase fold-3 domain-containing protein n=1 Tax=Linum tenue TaxID=586396 RepID=A0AAV0P392_9ROSI|nr:unnamed protein product [Linum tenue]